MLGWRTQVKFDGEMGGGETSFNVILPCLLILDKRLVDTIEHVICVDSIASDGPVYLHGARVPRDGNSVTVVLEQLQRAAAETSVSPLSLRLHCGCLTSVGDLHQQEIAALRNLCLGT